jgi:histidinol-phosphate aminotransferase
MALLRLSLNENPLGPSPLAVEAMQRALNESHLYPDHEANALRERLASFYNLQQENVLVTDGSTAGLEIIARTVLGPGLNAVTSAGSFIEYPIITKSVDAELIEVPLKNDGFDLDVVLQAINLDTRLIFFANPNNPTGTLATLEETDHFLHKVPESVVVILDEAYFEFAEYFAARRGVRYSRALEWIHEHENLLVLRTFSKVHGLAGLRVGYCLGPRPLLERVAEMKRMFCVSRPAQAAALAAMDDTAHMQRTLQANAEQAQWLTEQLSALGVRVPQTWTNFVYCDLGRDAGPVARQLTAEEVRVLQPAAWGLPHALRVTIGTPQQNQVFLAAFRRAWRAAG